MKGGTAINLTVFNLPRLSVDIDMDYTPNDTREDMLECRAKIVKQIEIYRLSLFCVPFYLGAIFQLHTFLSPVIKPEREETMSKEINTVGARIRELAKKQTALLAEIGDH